MQSGLSTNITSLQNLVYNYDAAGNVLTILDYKNGIDPNHPQVQTFAYDALDCLTNAAAAGGAYPTSDYAETYSYTAATGNLLIKGGAAWTAADLPVMK